MTQHPFRIVAECGLVMGFAQYGLARTLAEYVLVMGFAKISVDPINLPPPQRGIE